MIKNILILAFMCCSLVNLLGCSKDDKISQKHNKDSQVAKLKWIEKADPIEDAKKALKEKDFRLKTVEGYSIIVPGIELAKQSLYEKAYG